ncbi:3'-5' exoribonuclease YhaM [bacterium HR36]|nr:3'-5' exoribonuclease YhaM [bacterium HR36]
MPHRMLRQLKDGDSVEDVYLAGNKALRINRQGNPYLQVELRDRSGSMVARLWNATEQHFHAFREGECVFVRGRAQLFQGNIQLILTEIRPATTETWDPNDFLPQSEVDVSVLWNRLRQLVQVKDPCLRALLNLFLQDEVLMQGFVRAPAGTRVHHAYLGGLLEHVVHMLEIAERIFGDGRSIYPDVDRDLVVAGIFLHDIGKVRELAYATHFAYSDEGQLVGHVVIGVEMLQEKVRQVETLLGEPFPQELLLRLKHIIVSHHGDPESGSPCMPMTPEAMAVHLIDHLDSRLHMILRELREDRFPDRPWTDYHPHLERRLFRGQTNHSSANQQTSSPNG